jgi:predicted Zn-dependent protease
VSIYSSDRGLTRDSELAKHSEIAAVLREAEKINKKMPFPVLAGIILGLLALMALIGLFLAKDWILERITEQIPLKWEQSLGDSIYSRIEAEGKIVENSPWDSQVEAITKRLTNVVPGSGYVFRFHIMRDTNVNAFALPGGNVVILTGLLEQADSGEQVAGVLAHEIAHVTHRHSMRNLLQNAGLWVLIQSLFGDASGAAAVISQGSRYLLEQKFSRKFEREADEAGWDYLLAARIDPRGMIQFFEKLKALAGKNGEMNGSLSLLSSHPATQERIDELKEKWDAAASHPSFMPLPPWTKPE